MKINKVVVVILVISFLATLYFYTILPDTIPQHWSFDGEVDRYGSKSLALVTGILPLAIYLLMVFTPKIDPKKENYKKHSKAYIITSILIIFVIMSMHWISVLAGLGYDINIGLIAKVLIGILFIVIGNYMSQIRHNYFFGIKNPWTLANEKVWRKTHRIGGYGFILSGVFFIITIFLKHIIWSYISLASIIGVVILVNVYSYFVYKKEVDN